MTALFEIRIRAGGDPRGFAEFVALRDELAKLSHPARPDVDWARIEQLCLTLFQQNGADLQSAAVYALARSQRNGLHGMVEGVALIGALGSEWPKLWPPMSSVRLDILDWLFAQLQSSLRSLPLDARSLPALVHLDTELLRLDHQLQLPLAALQALRQHLENLMPRLPRDSACNAPLPLATRDPGLAHLMPIVIWSTNPAPPKKSVKGHVGMWLCAVVVTIFVAGAAWLSGFGLDSQGAQRITSLLQQEPAIATSVHLDSLALFDAGSAELKADSTKVLINALVDIKAQPGWLIVISGHSDDRGNPELNRQLSHARAAAVRGWMQRMGDIPDSCFVLKGVAASQPVASNATQTGRASNRRVDISLVPQAGACA
jgi:type VI secretion system protein VasL